MDPIECRCPHCRGLVRLPPDQVGQIIRCGRCRGTFARQPEEEERIVPADVPTGPDSTPPPVPAIASRPGS